jgi:predicted nucleic acid-binding protein
MSKPPRIYIDACPLIDAAKQAIKLPLAPGRETELAYLKLILESAAAGEIEACTSTLTVAECLHAKGNMSDEVKRVFRSLLTSGQYLRLVTPDPFVAEDARNLRWVHDINIDGRGADYLHVACALYVKCAEFVTFDGPIRDQNSKLRLLGMRVAYPSECAALPSERKQVALPLLAPVLPIRGRKKN